LPGEAKALLAAFIWGVTGVILAFLTRRIGTLSVNATRAVCGAVFLLVVIVPSAAGGQLKEMSAATAISMTGSGILAFAVGDSFYLLALRSLGASIAVPIAESAYPLFTFLFAWLWLDETFSTDLLLGSALVVVGIIFLTSRGGAPATSEVGGGVVAEGRLAPGQRRGWRTGLPVVLSASLFWALSTVWLRAGSGNLGPEAASIMRIVPVAAILLAAAYGSPAGLQMRRYRPADLAGAAIVGVFGLGVASLLYVSAIQDVGASRTAILTATVPLFTLPLAVVFLKERVTLRVVAGTLVCTVGIWFII
jgi:DME family drug/metabolite transporter